MNTDWIFAVAVVLIMLTVPAAANDDVRGIGWRGGYWDDDLDDWDDDWSWRRGGFYGGLGGIPVIAGGYSYPMAYPVTYPVAYPAGYPLGYPAFVPVGFDD